MRRPLARKTLLGVRRGTRLCKNDVGNPGRSAPRADLWTTNINREDHRLIACRKLDQRRLLRVRARRAAASELPQAEALSESGSRRAISSRLSQNTKIRVDFHVLRKYSKAMVDRRREQGSACD